MTPEGAALEIPLPARRLRGHLVRAAGGTRPGIVVIHEIFGLNDQIMRVAGRIAAEGYHALAVDLFSEGPRGVCLARIFAGIFLRPLRNGTVASLVAALDHLRSLPGVDPARVGVIGFCMGGSYALQLACVDANVRAASVFYGQNPRPLDAVARACPIVGSYPERDFTAGQGRALAAALERHGIPHDVKVYPGARHSFFNEDRGAYDPAAADDAWRRTMAFFRTHLGA